MDRFGAHVVMVKGLVDVRVTRSATSGIVDSAGSRDYLR